MTTFRAIVLVGNLEEGWSGTPQDLLAKFAELARVQMGSEEGVAGAIQFGGTDPGGNHDVLWIDNGSDTVDKSEPRLMVYNTKLAKYAPIYYIPVGGMMPFAMNAAELKDWLPCDDTKYLVADYPELYAAIGNLWGGTPDVDFYVPDMRGRVPVGEGTGTDYAGDKGDLITRDMGSAGQDSAGESEASPGSHPGYPGHDFGTNTVAHASRSKLPKGQWVNLSPVTGGKILNVTQPSTVLKWFIKCR